jgi:hypothetical protein
MEVINFDMKIFDSSNNYCLAPQCNPSIFSIALLPSDAIREESVPKDHMNWASIIGR